MSPAAMAISTVDEGKFIDVNESFLLISGYSREELIGNRSVDVGVIGPDERAKVMEFIRRQGYVRNHEFPAVTKTGQRLTVLSSTDVINMGGKDHLLSTIIDITDRTSRRCARASRGTYTSPTTRLSGASRRRPRHRIAPKHG